MSANALPPEDEARANLYGLLARLFYAPPDPELLRALAGSDEIVAEGHDAALSEAWRKLARAAEAMDAEAARDEYESVFIGTGRAEVSLYAGMYLTRTSLDQPLVEVRGFLARQGLARTGNAEEPEDHVSALCDAMRHFITRSEAETQHAFFQRFVWPTAVPLCDAIKRCERVNFYRHVAELLRCLTEVDHASFDMD